MTLLTNLYDFFILIIRFRDNTGSLFFGGTFIYCILHYVLLFNRVLQTFATFNIKVLYNIINILKQYFKYLLIYTCFVRLVLLLGGIYNIFGDILALIFILIYNFVAFTAVLANVSVSLVSEKEDYNRNINMMVFVTSVHFVLFFFFSIFTVIYILHFVNDIDLKKKLLFTFFSIMCTVKMVGNITTKLGDVISDYRNKIVNNIEEDTNNSVFDYLDNIGDIIGDMFSNFTDLLLLIIIVLCCINMHINFDDYIHKSFSCIGKLFSFFFVTGILQSFLSYFQLSRFIDFIFILNVVFWLFIDALRRNLSIWNCFSFSLKSMIPDIAYLLFFISLLALFNFYSLFNFYRRSYLHNKEFYSILGGYCIFYSIAYSLFHSCSIFFITFLMSKLVSAIYGNFNFNQLVLGPVLWHYLFLFSCYCIFKSFIGVAADSAGGFLSKINMTPEYTNKVHFLEEIIEIYEQYDQLGNIYKLETRIFLCVLLFLTVISNIKAYGFVFAVYFMTSCIIYVFIKIWKDFMKRKKVTYSSIFITINRHVALLASVFLFVIIRLATQSKLNILWYENIISITYVSIFLSIFSGIFGSMLDIYKKHSNNDFVSHEYKKTLIQHDICGDFLKDVLCPTMYSISAISILALACIQ